MFLKLFKASTAFFTRLIASHIHMFGCIALFGFIIGFATSTYDDLTTPQPTAQTEEIYSDEISQLLADNNEEFDEEFDRDIQSEVVSPELDDEAPTSTGAFNWVPRSDGRKLTGGGAAGYLDACDKVQIGSPCKSRRQGAMITKDFAYLLMAQMPICVNKALAAQGLGKMKKVVVIGDTYANRNVAGSRKKSMHSTGRAMDLWKLNVTLENGSKFNVNMTKASRNSSSKGAFYKKFVSCWQEANRARCSGKGGLTQRAGCLDAAYNHAHHNHVHMSMPFCPAKPGIAKN